MTETEAPGAPVRVGFVGLGDQGGPIAMRIHESGFPLTVWARREASVSRFRAAGVEVAPSLAALGSRCGIVGICVVDDDDVQEVVVEGGLLDAMGPGSVLVIHSTVHPDTCRRIGALGEPHGVTVLDAPVSGMAAAAREGRLAIMVGGAAEGFARCEAVFRACGNPVHLGPLGHGQLAKLINNMLGVSQFATVLSAVEVGRALGFEPERLAEAMQLGMGASAALGRLAATGFDPCYGIEPTLLSRLVAKDVRIALDVFAAAGADGGLLTQATAVQLQRIAVEARHRQSARKPPSTGSATPVT